MELGGSLRKKGSLESFCVAISGATSKNTIPNAFSQRKVMRGIYEFTLPETKMAPEQMDILRGK